MKLGVRESGEEVAVGCGVCGKGSGRYQCPRCGVVYCGVRCYKGHGECTEEFYKGLVGEYLKEKCEGAEG